MRAAASNLLLHLAALTWLVAGAGTALAEGRVSVPSPAKPAGATQCVEPVEVMRREHMRLLDHQRDATVIDGARDGKYSLVGCMNCHNPVQPGGEILRYEDPEHFCAECHAYTSVRIDCFECHADRGYEPVTQGALGNDSGLNAATLRLRVEADGD